MTKSPVVHLTRRAALDLRDIYNRSQQIWGEDTATQYIDDIYVVIKKAAANPDAGFLRHPRSVPFLMVAARQHFVIYDRVSDGIVVLTVQHQVRDIEVVIRNLTSSFHKEVENFKRKIKG